ncbi:GL18698 [Drosophila persimilis]|uniref:GL18698 n=1 Tax=Drosophila persimilis TaxID=7234 RepID=B4G983_DROPE|nr:GL18698 [Drosophila persimilis]
MSSLIFVYLAISLGSALAADFNPFLDLECVDCKEDCGVRSTGSSCLSLDRQRALRTFTPANVTRMTLDHYHHLQKCIPKDEVIRGAMSGRLIVGLAKGEARISCCALFAQLGCQLIKRISGTQRTCDSCKALTQDSPEIELCPCKAAHVKLCSALLLPILMMGIIYPYI